MLLNYLKHSLRNHDGSHDIYHSYRVLMNLGKYYEIDKYNSIACLFHDSCDPKYTNKYEKLSELKEVLTGSTHYDISEINDIASAIEHVSYKKLIKEGEPKFLNERSFRIWRQVSDADMIDAIGKNGLIRCLLYEGYTENLDLDSALDYITIKLRNIDYYISVRDENITRLKNEMISYAENIRNSEKLRILAKDIMLEGYKRKPFDKIIIDTDIFVKKK